MVTATETESINVDEDVSAGSSSASIVSSPKFSAASYVKYKKLVNRSSEKLRHSLFNKQQNLLGRTRSETVNVGKRKIPQKVAKGYKLINSALLSGAIYNSTVCKHCKNSCSKLVLKEKTMMRYGLAEELSINCSICEKSTQVS